MNILRFCKNYYESRNKFRNFLNDIALEVYTERQNNPNSIVSFNNSVTELDKLILETMKSYEVQSCGFSLGNWNICFNTFVSSSNYNVKIRWNKKEKAYKVSSISEVVRIVIGKKFPQNSIWISFNTNPNTFYKNIICKINNLHRIDEVFISPKDCLVMEEDLLSWSLKSPNVNDDLLDKVWFSHKPPC